MWFGNKFITRKGEAGTFWCFECPGQRRYARTDVHDYFCMCILPFWVDFLALRLWSHGVVSSEILCEGCGNSFPVESLHGMTERQMSQMLSLTQGWLLTDSIEEVQASLREQKIPEDQIKRILSVTVGKAQRKCQFCRCSFATPMEICVKCYRALSPEEAYTETPYNMKGIVTWLAKEPSS